MSIKSRIRYAAAKILIGAIAGGLFGAFGSPVQAADIFENEVIEFEEDTVVEFEFVESNGAYQSVFGVINLDTGEKTPLIVEAKPSDQPQNVTVPSDYEDDAGLFNTDDFHGTPGNAVPEPLPEFEFQANTRYAFYLESYYNGRPAGTIYSTDIRNPGSKRLAFFEGGFEALTNGGSLIRWDDTGSVLVKFEDQDIDSDDFIVRAGGHQACNYEENVSGN
ncbi:MAG: hypothetical protein F6K58_02755 [Symploca sp. SIO2E9]|nr:hypothetical protein [Symploca sp. SIO2E9]